MELEEITRQLDRLTGTFRHGGNFDAHWAAEVLSAARECLDDADADDGPPASVDDGFVILPVARYEALREAEEQLQETRFGPTDGDGPSGQGVIDALTGECQELRKANLKWRDNFQAREAHISAQALEIGRLKGEAKVAAAAPRQVSDEVLVKHIQDLQAEIDGIKDRLDEGCGEFNKIKARLDEQSDRLHGFIARMNRLEADVMPIRRIGPGTGPPDQQRDEATRDRLLQEIKRVAGGVESTKP
jgi:hypothetical protein